MKTKIIDRTFGDPPIGFSMDSSANLAGVEVNPKLPAL
jgi:hypothetical protein